MAGTIAGTRFSGMWRPAKTTRGSLLCPGWGSSGPSYAPASMVISPRSPSSRSRRA